LRPSWTCNHGANSRRDRWNSLARDAKYLSGYYA
jgi:hypothetical protein